MRILKEKWGCHTIYVIEVDYPIKIIENKIGTVCLDNLELYFSLEAPKTLEEIHGEERVKRAKDNSVIDNLQTHRDILIRRPVKEKIGYYEEVANFYVKKHKGNEKIEWGGVIQREGDTVLLIGLRVLSGNKMLYHGYRTLYGFEEDNLIKKGEDGNAQPICTVRR